MTLFPSKYSCRVVSLFYLSGIRTITTGHTHTTSANLDLDLITCNLERPDLPQKIRTKKFALYVGYRGGEYHGFMMNPGQSHVSSVGSKIVEALVKAGYMDESALGSMNSISQTSRTDGGVSALRQIATVQLPIDADLHKIKQFLPDAIKIFGMTRTTPHFVPHKYCSARSYLYYIPSYVFAPQTIEMYKGYRLDNATIDKIRTTLEHFVGTKNYHNFTAGRSFQDPRCKRLIREAELCEPIMIDEFQLACIRLHGDSFILHQIRKIIGAVVAVVRGYAPETLIDIAFSREGLTISRAPPEGLVLDNVHFDYYNKRFAKTHDPLDWSQFEDEVNELRSEILSDIVSAERSYEKVKLWMEEQQFMPFAPFNKDKSTLSGHLNFDESLKIIRSEHVPVTGCQSATLCI